MEVLIKEQTRRYNQKMEEIQQLENAEALAVKQLKLRRQNTVRKASQARLQNKLFFEDICVFNQQVGIKLIKLTNNKNK